MSIVSASREMAQPNQLNNSGDMSAAPIKRKRGRPRKEELSDSESKKGTQQRLLHSTPGSNHSLVGQKVSGSLVGMFDAGYLLSVQVGSTGPTLKGLVFDPRLSVPVSSENDIAPHLPMLRRDGSSTSPLTSESMDTPKAPVVEASRPPGGSSKLVSFDLSKPPDDSPMDEFKEMTPSNASNIPKPSVAHKTDAQGRAGSGITQRFNLEEKEDSGSSEEEPALSGQNVDVPLQRIIDEASHNPEVNLTPKASEMEIDEAVQEKQEEDPSAQH